MIINHLQATRMSIISRKTIFIVLLLCSFSTLNAQTVLYAEGADLPNTGNGTTLTISSAGTYTVSGTVMTAADGQDRHELVINSGLQLTAATYAIGAGGSPSGGQINWAGLANPTWSASSSGSIGLPGLPYGAGTYSQIMVAVNFSTGTTWTITYTVTATASAPTITSNPSNSSVCSPTATSFTVGANNSPTSYTWQVNNGGGYANISNGGVYSNATTATLSISNSTGLNGYLYRASATNGTGTSSFSTAATLTVNSAPSITSNPSNASTCSTSGTSFTVAGNNSPTSYTWQVNNGGGYVNIPNGGIYSTATTATLNISSTAGLNGYLYRAIANNGCGSSSASTAATLTVTTGNPTIITAPSNSTICQNGNTTFSVTAGNTSAYQWYVQFPGGGVAQLTNGGFYSGVTTNTLTILGATTALDGNKYYCILINDCSPLSNFFSSGQGILTVLPAVGTTVFTLGATSTRCQGAGTVTYGATATNSTSMFYTLDATSSGAGNSINSSTGAVTYTAGWSGTSTITATPSGCGSLTSATHTVTINALPNISVHPASNSFCNGSAGSFSVTASGTGIGYQWQESPTGVVWTDVGTSTNTLGFVASGVKNNYQYRVIVTGTCPPAVTSNIATLTVTQSPILLSSPSNSTICAGTNTTFGVNATGTSLAYQWQENTGSGFTNITNGGVYSNATAGVLNITGATATMNNYQYRCFISGTCAPSVTSNPATLTVNTAPVITTQPNSTAMTVCANTGSAACTTAATGTGLSYQWQENQGSGFNNISNGGSYLILNGILVINTPPASMNGYQYQCIVSGTCPSPVTSNPVTLTVNTAPAVTSPPSNTISCSGTNTVFSVTASGAGLIYQWQENLGSGFANLSNGVVYSGTATNTLTITNTPLGLNTAQYRCYISGTCTPATTSASAALTVNETPAITSQPANSTTCAGTNTGFSLTASGTGIAYQWQENTGSGFANITNGGIYSFATANSLAIANPAISMNGYTYRCIVTGTCTPPAVTNTVTLFVNTPTTVTSQPVSGSFCENGTSTFSVTVSGGSLVYLWQVNTGSGFTNLANGTNYSGVHTANLNVLNTPLSFSGYQYRCFVTGNCTPLTVNSNSATLTVLPIPVVTVQPANTATCIGNNASFSVTAGGAGLSYQWQESTNGGTTWANLSASATYSNITAATMNITGAPLSMNGYKYRCIITGTCSPVAVTNAATLTINTAPVITTDPANTTACFGTNTGFTVVATGAGLTYQWQLSTNGGTTWANLTNTAPYSTVTAATLTITNATSAINSFQYRCVVNGSCSPSATSAAATLTITPLVTITAQPPVNQVVCIGSNISLSITAAQATSYQWQFDSGSGFVALTNTATYSGVTTSTLSVTGASVLTNGTYRCIVGSGCSAPFASNTSILNVYPPTVITTQPTSGTFCQSQNSYFTVNATGSTLVYQWQVSSNGGTSWANLSNAAPYSGVNANQLTITNTSFSLNTFQYRCVIIGACLSTAVSSAAVLTVTPLVTITTQPPAQTVVCIGSATSLSATIANATSYQWQLDQGSGFINVPNAVPYSGVNTATLSISNASVATNGTYRCVAGNSCSIVPTNSAILNVSAPTVITSQPTTLTTCSGVNSYFTVNATGSSVLTYQWQVSTNGGSTWANLTAVAPYGGVTSNQLTIFATPALLTTYQYRCLAISSCNSIAISNAAILTVNTPPVVTVSPANSIVCLGTNTSYSVTATGTSISYQWQVYNNITWVNVINNAIYSNATTSTLNLTGVTGTMNGYAYRCIVTGICPNNPATSNQASLTVNMPPSVTTQPTDKTICLGTGTSYSVSATGTATLTYQWQADQGSGFVNIANGANYNGVTTNTLSVNFPPLNFNGYKYRCAVSGPCAPAANSNLALLSINDTATVVSVPFNDTLCTGDSSLFAINPGGPVTSIQWQESNGVGGFSDLPPGTPPYIGVNTPVLKIAPVNKSLYGKQYRAVVSSSCNTVISNTFSTVVYTVADITVNPLDVTVTDGLDAVFNVEGSDPDHIYYWQASSDTGKTFSNIYNNSLYSGVQSKTLTVIKANPAESGWQFRCITKDNKNYCYKQYDTSSTAKLTVTPHAPFPVSVTGVTNGDVKFSVYPNPVHGNELMIKVNSTSIKTIRYRVIDQFGRILQDDKASLSNTGIAPVNVGGLISGIYTIQFVDANNAINQSIRFTKQE